MVHQLLAVASVVFSFFLSIQAANARPSLGLASFDQIAKEFNFANSTSVAIVQNNASFRPHHRISVFADREALEQRQYEDCFAPVFANDPELQIMIDVHSWIARHAGFEIEAEVLKEKVLKLGSDGQIALFAFHHFHVYGLRAVGTIFDLVFCADAEEVHKRGIDAYVQELLLISEWLKPGRIQAPQQEDSRAVAYHADTFERYMAGEQAGNINNADLVSRIEKTPSMLGLGPQDVYVLQWYSGAAYSILNRMLWEGLGPGYTLVRRIARSLDIALAKTPRYQGMVNRGTGDFPGFLERHEVGATVTYPAFISTAAGVGFKLSVRLHIYTPDGNYIAPISKFFEEQEVLFRTQSRFKIIDRFTYGTETHIVMKELPSQPAW